MDFDDIEKKIEDLKNLNDEEVSERLDKYLVEKAAKSASVRMSIKRTFKFSKELRGDDEEASKKAISACMKAMVVNAAAELGGNLSDKDMKKLEGIAMHTIAEEIGEE